jgi:hypothetical protein
MQKKDGLFVHSGGTMAKRTAIGRKNLAASSVLQRLRYRVHRRNQNSILVVKDYSMLHFAVLEPFIYNHYLSVALPIESLRQHQELERGAYSWLTCWMVIIDFKFLVCHSNEGRISTKLCSK